MLTSILYAIIDGKPADKVNVVLYTGWRYYYHHDHG